MQTEKSQPEGKRIMPGTRFTEFPALFVDPRVEISHSAWRPLFDYFLTFVIKNYYLLSVFSFIFDILRCITTFSERHLVCFAVVQK